MSQETQDRLQKVLADGTKEQVAEAAFLHGETIGRESTPAPQLSGPELYEIWRHSKLTNGEATVEWEHVDATEQVAWEVTARTAAGQLTAPSR